VLASRITCLIKTEQLPKCCELMVEKIVDLPEHERFDTVLYIDVPEHIERDQRRSQRGCQPPQEMRLSRRLLACTPFHIPRFDRTIGHYRSYTQEADAEPAANITLGPSDGAAFSHLRPIISLRCGKVTHWDLAKIVNSKAHNLGECKTSGHM